MDKSTKSKYRKLLEIDLMDEEDIIRINMKEISKFKENQLITLDDFSIHIPGEGIRNKKINYIPRFNEIIIPRFKGDHLISLEDLRIRFSIYGTISCRLYPSLKEKIWASILFQEDDGIRGAIFDVRRHEIGLYHQGLEAYAKAQSNTENVQNRKKLQIEEDPPDCNINKLNEYCLLNIFGYLLVRERLLMKRVCTRWCTIANTSLLLSRSLDLLSPKYDLRYYGEYADYIKQINKSVIELKNLLPLNVYTSFFNKLEMTDFSDQVMTTELHILALTSSKLKKLIVRTTTIDENVLSYILMANKNLEHIEIIRNIDINGMSLINLSEKIHTLIVKDCYLKFDHLYTALERLQNIKELRLINCCGWEIFYVFYKSCKQLEIFEFQRQRYGITEDVLLPISELHNLKVLKISQGLFRLDDALNPLIVTCRQIKHMEIIGNDIADYYFNYWMRTGYVNLTLLASLPDIEKLVIHNIFHISTFNFPTICNLKEFECQISSISNAEIIAIIKASPELRLLSLYRCMNICVSEIINEAKLISDNRRNNVTLEIIIKRYCKYDPILKMNTLLKSTRHVICNGCIYLR